MTVPYARIFIASFIGAALLLAAEELLQPTGYGALAAILVVLLVVGSWATRPLTHGSKHHSPPRA